MRSFFATRLWPAGQHLLHLYVLPDQERLQPLLRAYAPVLVTEPSVMVVPHSWLHATVLKLPHQPSAGELSALIRHLTAALDAVPAFDLTAGPALAGASAVVADLTPDAPWQHLRAAAAAAAHHVLGPKATTPAAERPHLTLAYGVADGDSGTMQSRLRAATDHRATLHIDRVHLVDVEQRLDLGGYRWTTLATLHLGKATRSPGTS